MHALARALQVLGLILLPLGLYYGMMQREMKAELLILLIGATIFTMGLVIERSGGKSR